MTAARIVLAALVAVFPFVFGHKLESLDRRYVLSFLVLAALLAVTEVYHESSLQKALDRTYRDLTDERQRLEASQKRLAFQTARGLTMARLLELLRPVVSLLEHDPLSPDESKQAIAELDNAIGSVLKAVSDEVRAYYGLNAASKVNASLMLAYETANCPREVHSRVRFLEYGRDFGSYKHVLDVVRWANPDPAFSAIAVPVEDPVEETGRRRLLPGAPAAFALGQDHMISDTSALTQQVAPDLDHEVLERQLNYFREKDIGSMACLVLRDSASPIGILNIHAREHNLFSGEDWDLVIKSIEHYRYSLQYLLSGQRQLTRNAS